MTSNGLEGEGELNSGCVCCLRILREGGGGTVKSFFLEWIWDLYLGFAAGEDLEQKENI